MRRLIPLLIAIPLLVVLISSGVKAQSTNEKQSLRGLKGVYVLVENISEDVEREGLTKSQIQTDAELKLRKAGIHVATRGESLDSNIGALHISVQAKPIRTVRDLYAISTTVELMQEVRLLRDPSITVFSATTYQVPHGFGTVGVDHLRDDLRNAINDDVDAFINDYLAMNQK